jgi:hypothetical protein
MVVDGEHFDVRERPGEPGVYERERISRPNVGYGFACASYGGPQLTEAEIEDAIRNFLMQVDPRSGYIA